jgi:cytochrome c oxidase subunit 3
MADAVSSLQHDPGEHASHPANLAHHFTTPAQQFDSGKLGMWLFLATEVLLFGGLFCWYSVFRSLHPEVFEAGHVYLNKWWGAVNTVILLVSSFTMATGVYAAQTSRRRLLIVCLALTLLGGAGFMGVKYVEYREKWKHGLLWGSRFKPTEHHDAHDAPAAELPTAPAAAHAPAPAGTTGEPAAAHANPSPAAAHVAAAAAPPVASAGAAGGTGSASSSPAEAAQPEFSQIKPAAVGPTGLAHLPTPTSRRLTVEEERAKNIHLFFSIYFTMTGLHGLHVLAGMAVIAWLLVRSVRGDFSATYFTPVDLGGLYWHLVDLIWIYLFPLLYLIT